MGNHGGRGRLYRSIADARLIGDPVHFPRYSSVSGEGLLKVRGIRRDAGPGISNQDHAAIESVLAVELADPVLEFAHLGRAGEGAILGVGPIQIPLAGWRV